MPNMSVKSIVCWISPSVWDSGKIVISEAWSSINLNVNFSWNIGRILHFRNIILSVYPPMPYLWAPKWGTTVGFLYTILLINNPYMLVRCMNYFHGCRYSQFSLCIFFEPECLYLVGRWHKLIRIYIPVNIMCMAWFIFMVMY